MGTKWDEGEAARQLSENWNQLAQELGVADRCQVEIEREGNWFVLHGWVDSQQTKGRLFSLVPEIDGEQWIVDRIRLGRPELSCAATPSVEESSVELQPMI
jgi:hypothetical protein